MHDYSLKYILLQYIISVMVLNLNVTESWGFESRFRIRYRSSVIYLWVLTEN